MIARYHFQVINRCFYECMALRIEICPLSSLFHSFSHWVLGRYYCVQISYETARGLLNERKFELTDESYNIEKFQRFWFARQICCPAIWFVTVRRMKRDFRKGLVSVKDRRSPIIWRLRLSLPKP